jgi:eukaryotic-like serine/threonine-protein kinase
MPLDPEALLRRLEAAGFTDEASDLRTSGSLEHVEAGESESEDGLPDQLGPFEIVGELGQGGYGVVLLGAQHRPVRRLAAVKLLKRGMDSRSVLARFRAEQQALAMMDHRAVATVFETGVAADGRPWFAMPLVAGVPITVHADLERLGVEARLRLFREAALGVMHAHERGVLHRDLKPSNILVGVERGAAQPRVIDFGIAKAIDATNPLVTHATMGEAVLGTPAYMAPEQALGRADVRSDVWSLGVILGELLAGVRPLDREPARGADGRLDAGVFVRPSERFHRWMALDASAASEAATARGCASDALTVALRGDLDAIVGHCLEEEPGRRYGSVAALIEDIDRHLSGRPVMARPASAAYLASRFARRHRWSVAAVAVVVASLIVATVVSVRAAIVARGEARASRAVTDFLVQMLGAADPWRPGGQQDVRVRDALDAAAVRLSRGEFAGREREAARIELAIGAARLQLGLAQEARPALERAVATLRGADASERSALAEALHRLGLCAQALGDLPAAETALRESVALHEASDGPESTLCLQARNDLALCLQERGDVESAERIYREVLQALGASSEARPEVRAGTLGNLGMLLQGTGRLQEAKDPILQALETNRARLGGDDLELAMDWNNLGLLQKDLGELPDAENSLRESLRILRRGLDAGHPNIALVEINLADLLPRMDRGPEAIELLTQAAETVRKAYGPDHSEVARAHNMLGFALRDAGKARESEGAFREAVRIWRISPGGDHPDLATGLNNLARAAQDSGRPQEALPLAEEAVAMIGKASGDDDPRRWVFLARRGSILVDMKRWTDADAHLRAALEGLERCQAPVSRRRTVLEALVKCHEGWSAAEPTPQRRDAAASWRKQLETLAPASS